MPSTSKLSQDLNILFVVTNGQMSDLIGICAFLVVGGAVTDNISKLNHSKGTGRQNVHDACGPNAMCFIDIKADNLLFLGPNMTEIEETITKEPALLDGTFMMVRIRQNAIA